MSKINWEIVQSPRHAKFDTIGDRIAGRVIYYSPDTGETTYNDEPCGYLDMTPLGGGPNLRVTLDNPNLADRIRDAYPVPGMLLGIKYVEDTEGKNGRTFKRFECYRGVEQD